MEERETVIKSCAQATCPPGRIIATIRRRPAMLRAALVRALALRVSGIASAAQHPVLGAVGRTGYVQTLADRLLVLLGVLLGSWQDALMPYFIRRSAGAYYDANKERMIAKNLLFTNHTVQIKTDRYEAHLDYGLLFRAL